MKVLDKSKRASVRAFEFHRPLLQVFFPVSPVGSISPKPSLHFLPPALIFFTVMEDASTSSMAPQKSKLKIGGSWSGVLEAELEVWTLPMLREEVAKRSNSTPDCINLICSGKVLKDGDGSAKLAELGLKNNSRILATRISADQGKALKAELLAEEERSRRLSRIRWCF